MTYAKSYIKKCKALKIPPLSQDDLVEMCKVLPKYEDKSYLKLLSCFRVTLSKMCCDSYLNTQTLNDLWLMFYIRETQGKLWFEGSNKWK